MEGRLLALPQAPDTIELRHLRSFVAVADELNFGRAATRLYLSQPALSRQIQALERLVGCDLLRRSTHRVELTAAGEALLDRARKLLADLDEAISATRSASGELAGRAYRYWHSLASRDAGPELEELRRVCETMHAEFAPPPETTVRPVNAGGVSCFQVGAGQAGAVGPEPATVLYLHGGAYVMGSAYGYRHVAGALALASGATTLVPEYRLAPEHPFPAALEDVTRAYQWMLEQAGDARRLVVAGDSSGAGLAVSLLLSLKQRGAPMPGGVVLFCPGVDMCRDSLAQSDSAISLDLLRRFVSAYLAEHPPEDPVVSPLSADLSGLPPMLIQGGTDDPFVDDAERLADHARGHGVEVRLELYPVATHSFQIFWSFLPEAAEALAAAGRFVRSLTTGRKSPTFDA
ncbi:alpha/beta hydrolase fold domain-containing protein [Nonomuraea sp. NPDC050663]|uniref:alpha/beta hydrolase fold domain-containing protein n=1 Tax=Nonomuraea sp. NPDC050663 TaxID=3364370 RepID=UPI0037BC9608